MFDLWHSLTANLCRLYEKRKEDLYDESCNKRRDVHQRNTSRQTWTRHNALSPRRLHVDDSRPDTIDAIVARTREILSRSAAASAAQRTSVLGKKPIEERGSKIDSSKGGDDGEGGRKLFFPVIVASSSSASIPPPQGIHQSILSMQQQQRNAYNNNDDHEDYPPLVQRVGLSIEHKKKVLRESEVSNKQFSEMVAKHTSVTAVGGGLQMETISSDDSRLHFPSEGSALEPSSVRTAPIAVQYPITLPKGTLGTGGSRSSYSRPADDANNSTSTSSGAPPTSASASPRTRRIVSVQQIPIDWPKVQAQVAEELAAIHKRDDARFRLQGSHAQLSYSYSNKNTNKSREELAKAQQVTEIDAEKALRARVAATEAAASTLEVNKAFEGMQMRKFIPPDA